MTNFLKYHAKYLNFFLARFKYILINQKMKIVKDLLQQNQIKKFKKIV